jgi:hypothetical protein
MPNDYSHDDLVTRVNTPGWRLTGGTAPVEGKLDDVLRVAHDRQTSGDHPGRIEQIETAIELDLIQMQQLWRHLGLPV